MCNLSVGAMEKVKYNCQVDFENKYNNTLNEENLEDILKKISEHKQDEGNYKQEGGGERYVSVSKTN